MRNYRTLALRELSAQKLTSLLILIAVVLSTTLTAAVGQSAGVLSAMRQQQAITLGGNRHASLLQLTEADVQVLENDPRLSYTGRSVSLGSMDLNDQLSLGVTEYWGDSLDAYPSHTRLVAGRLPAAPLELTLPEDALQFLGLDDTLGQTIPLPLSKALRHGVEMDAYDYTADFTLVGITESNYLNYTGGMILGLAGEGSGARLLPPEYIYYNVDLRVADQSRFQETMDDLCQTLHVHELDALYNVPYLNALGIHYDPDVSTDSIDGSDEGFSYLLLVGILVVGLILLAAGLVIYNILKIAVSQRLKHYGALRAIGAEQGQLYTVIALEILLLCAVGIPLGLLLGGLSAKGILTAALNQLPPSVFLAQDTEQLHQLIAENSSGKGFYLLLSAGVTLLFAFLAAAPAARFAAKVSPVTALAGSAQKIKRKPRKMKPIRNFPRYYAWLNLGRSRGRTALTILSLMMSITVFLTLQSVLGLLSVDAGTAEHLGDYAIVNQQGGIPKDELDALSARPDVTAVAAQQWTLYELEEPDYRPADIETDVPLGLGETFQIFGYNDVWMDSAFSDRLSPQDLEALKSGTGCVVRNPIPMEVEGTAIGTSHIDAGETITVAGVKLPVLLSLSDYDGYFSVGNSGFMNGIQVLVSDKLYPQLTGTENYAELRPALTPDADREIFDGILDQLTQRLPGTSVVSYEDTDRQLAESEAQIKLLAWGLILFIGLIGVLNIINTVSTNLHTRTAEIGTQRAIGMSRTDLYKTFLWEGADYGLIAAVLGCVTGWAASVLAVSAASETFTLSPPPLPAMGLACGVSVLACLLATAIPLRRLAVLDITEAVERAE